MNKKLIIIGASGHGKVIADIAKLNGYEDIGFIDDDMNKKTCGGYPVLGTLTDIDKYWDRDFIVGIGNCKIRRKIQERLVNQGMMLVSLIHPNSVVAANVKIGIGTVVMAGAIINPDTVIGDGCIINTAATLDHENIIEDYVHISVGVHLAGNVHVGKESWIGVGSCISNNIQIYEDCVIGAGTVVIRNIEESGTYVGVPARKIK